MGGPRVRLGWPTNKKGGSQVGPYLIRNKMSWCGRFWSGQRISAHFAMSNSVDRHLWFSLTKFLA